MDPKTNAGAAHPVLDAESGVDISASSPGADRRGGTERRRGSFLSPQLIASDLARSSLDLF